MSRQNSQFKKDRQSDESKKRTDNRSEKGPTIETQKGPTNYIPVTVSGVIGEGDLKLLLHRFNQGKWITRKKIAGLLQLLDLMIRKGGKTFKISSELSHEYVRRSKGNCGTIQQPLALLVHIGILEKVRKAKVGPHLKVSAEYRFHYNYSRRSEMEIFISPQQLAKRENAGSRKEGRLNRKHPFRARLIVDMERLSLSAEGESQSLNLIVANQKEDCTRRLIESLNGTREKAVKVDSSGTISTFINGTPKELKPHLEIDGKPVAKCDIEGAHFCILQRIVRDRITYYQKQKQSGFKIEMLEKEAKRFSGMIEAGDIYSQGRPEVTKDERKEKKLAMLSALNMKTSVAIHIPEYRWLRETFPLTFRIVEDIKKNDHRALSIQLRNYTARIINGALRRLQEMDIPAFPDTDALIVTKENGQLARETIEGFLREVAGDGKVSVS